jgi:CzcA family heavy metal efflux pump
VIGWIVRSSLRFRYIVAALAAGMLVLGFLTLPNSKVDVFPEFAPPRIEVQTIALGLTPTEVEDLVTVPLEQSLQGVPDLDVIRSKSVPQLSQIELLFKRGTDLLQARQLVQERMATATPNLPNWASPPFMIQPLSATSRAMKIGIKSDKVSMIDLSTIAYWKIRARLLGVPGVANVPIWGERLEQLQVQTDPAKLAANGVSLEQVMTQTAGALDAGLLRFADTGYIGSGGFVEAGGKRLDIRHKLAIQGPDDLAAIPIEGHTAADGTPLTLGDVATVKIDHQPLTSEAVIDGGRGLMLIVEKLPWANTLDVTRGVEEAIDDLRPGLPGIEIDTTIFRPATFVEQSLENLSEALIIGAILVVIVLALFLFSWRSALISLVTIPISLTVSALILHWRGTTINTMVLAGFVIAIGAVVDDAIVDTENIVRRLRQHRSEPDGRSTARVIYDASLEVRGAVIYASLIEALALLPIFFLSGLTGAFFTPLATSYAIAVIVSMMVALITTPAFAMILLRGAKLDKDNESPIARRLQNGYERSLKPIIRTPWPAYVAVAGIVVAGAIAAPQLGQELLPDFKERDFLMHWVTKPDTSHEEEYRISAKVAKELLEIPGVRNEGSHIGQAFLADEPYGIHFGENWISIDEDVDYDETRAKVQEVVDGYPGIRRDVQTYLKERIREVLTGSSETIVVHIFGDDLHKLQETAESLLDRIKKVDGVIEANVELTDDVPQLEVQVDLAKAERYGIKPGDVRRATATMIQSEEVGDIYRDGKAFDVHVWTQPGARSDVSSIRALPIDTADGAVVRLDEVADVNVEPQPSSIHRQNATRTIEVGANVEGRDLASVANDIDAELAKVKLPLGYHTEVEGEYVERQEQDRNLLLYGLIAAFGIFVLLVVVFKSLRLGVLSFITLPMALVGGVLTASFFGSGILSLGSVVGFFTILGIVARNGIMQIAHFQHLEKEEGMSFGPDLVLRGATERITPIMMTALTTALALVPLLITGNIPGQEIEHPMAIVIVGGLIFSTLLNLFVVPSLYLRFGKRRAEREAIGAAV